MMISIIIPYFKNAKEIKRTIESVLNQSFQEFEVLIVNDASPDWDEALPIIKGFSDARIKLLSHEVNRNGAAARNTGIKSAKGNCIAFLDADDEWTPEHLHNLVQLIDRNKPSLIFSSCLIKSGHEYVLPKDNVNKSESISEFLFCDHVFIGTPSILVDTCLAKKNLFNEELKRHQDYDFLLRLAKKNIHFIWSKPATVIVHWEDNDTTKKGGTWKYSIDWLLLYKSFFTTKAYSNFALKFVVNKQFQERRIFNGLITFVIHCKPWHISLKEYFFTLSNLCFGKVIVPKFLKITN
ncbi:MAG: glycosyltransferase family 2 protein [Ferruginibacter sp.]